ALGQKPTRALHQSMSALPPTATAKADTRAATSHSCLTHCRLSHIFSRSGLELTGGGDDYHSRISGGGPGVSPCPAHESAIWLVGSRDNRNLSNSPHTCLA